jgi:hypothetical protein
MDWVFGLAGEVMGWMHGYVGEELRIPFYTSSIDAECRSPGEPEALHRMQAVELPTGGPTNH